MKVLIVIDMQVDFVSGSLGSPEAQAIVPNVVNKMKEYEKCGVVLFTKDTHFDNYEFTLEGKKLPIPHCIEGTAGWSLVREIHNEFKNGNYITFSDDNVINGRVIKKTFGSMELINLLNKYDIDEIEICGLVTNICVVSNALLLRAAFPNAPITVDASCCAGTSIEAHAAALEVMKSCQIDVIGE